MKKNISTVIEITDAHVKFAQAKIVRGKRLVSACNVQPLTQHTDEEIIDILTTIVRTKNIQVHDLRVVLPRRLVIVKPLQLPSHNEEEIRKMVKLQLVNQIPYGIDDVIYDVLTLDKDERGYMRVLAVAVHKDVVQQYLNIFKRLDLPVTHLTISSLGVLDWYIFQNHAAKEKHSTPTMVINIDMTHAEICFCHGQKLYFSRSIDLGAKDLNEEQVFKLVHQIELSMGAYRKQHMGMEIGKIWIVSSVGELEFLREKIEKDLKILTKTFHFSEHVVTKKTVSFSTLKGQLGLSLTVLFGFLFCKEKRIFNLMPREVHEHKKSESRKRQWVSFIILLVLSCGLAFSILGIELYQKENTLAHIEEQADQVNPQIAQANQQMDVVEQLDQKFKQRIFVSDIVLELYRIVPKTISFRSLQINSQQQLTIQGYAEQGSSVNDFQSSMVKSKVFHDVNLQFATKRKIFNMEVTDFKIVAQLKGK